MVTMVKMTLAFVGLIALAMVFPFVQDIFDFAEGNTTHPGMLMAAGGDSTNDAFLTFMPILIPVILFVGIIIYVVIGRKKNE